MKTWLRFLLFALLIVSFCQNVNASHAAGGELLYEHISGNQYRFKFKFYRDCSGINAPLTMQLCYSNTCNVTSPLSVMLQRTSGPILVNGDCPNISTNCASPNGLPSYQEYIYEGNINLIETCNAWRFWVNHNARNPMNFLSGTNLYVETSFNNTISSFDNSPTFNRLPVPYCCINTPFVYDNGASDIDGDSLVYESIMPRTHPTFNSCPSTPPQLCTYPSFSPALNFTTNPLPCNNSFAINSSTGLFSMTPSMQGKGVIAIKVSQYRNGQLLGYIVRDIQTIVMTCNISTRKLTLDSNSLMQCNLVADTIRACAENNFTFCFKTTSNDTTSLINIQSNISSYSSPSSLTHSNANSDSVYSCFNWTPNISDTGWHNLVLLVTDSICRPIGVLNSDSFTRIIPIYIFPKYHTYTNDTICSPDSLMGYWQTGIYIDTFINKYGCDSIRTLNLKVNTKSFSNDNKSICAPNSYMGYSQTGTYIDTFINSVGCDSIRTLNLIILPTALSTINQSICQSDSFLGYSIAGTYIDTFATVAGCDSVRILNLVVKPNFLFTINQTICAPNSFLGYNLSGTYVDTFTNASGCDSIRTLILDVLWPSASTIINQSICEPTSFMGYSQSGTFIDTFVNAFGCDSIRIINLTIIPRSFVTVNQSICFPNSAMGYNTSGTYIDTFTNNVGCDSVRTLNLVVLPISDTVISQTICEPNSHLGYAVSGTYIDTLVSANGCDSFRTLNLTVIPRTFSNINQIICEPNSYLGYTQTGVYIDTLISAAGCDSIRTLNLVVNPIKYFNTANTICETDTFMGYSQSGIFVDTFASYNGCDSIRTLNLTVLPISYLTIDTSICYPSNVFGYTAAGIYYDTLIDASGCQLRRTLNLNMLFPFYRDTTVNICQGERFYVNGTYQTTAGVYSDSLMTSVGCDSITKTTLVIMDIPDPNLGPDIEICEGETVHISPGTYDYYHWNNGDTNAIREITTSGQYIVRVQNAINRCFKYDTIAVNVIQYPKIEIQLPFDSLCIGNTVLFEASGAANFMWYAPNQYGITGNTISIYLGLYPQKITLEGWDNEKCKDSANAEILPIDCCSEIIIPNAFTPNGDGLNDRYGLVVNPQIEKLDFEIFNRWGQSVFKSNSFDEKWDGTFQGVHCEIGTYFYLIKSKCFTQKKPKFYYGDVNLIR